MHHSTAGPSPIRLLHVTTVPMTFIFLRGQIGFLRRHGIEAQLASSPPLPGEVPPGLDPSDGDPPIHEVRMPRSLTPFRDIASLLRMVRLIRRLRPHIVHSHTPKGGLLGMLAATLARVPVRVYHLRGLAYVTLSRPKQAFYRLFERISCFFAHRVICIGPSQREQALEEGLCRPEKIIVLANGGNGVDARGRFAPQGQPAEERLALRQRLGIPDQAVVAGFVGRLIRDKGVVVLEAAWRQLRETDPNLHLLIVGPREERGAVPEEVLERLEDDPRAHLPGASFDIAPYYAIMDLLVQPTLREGLPNAPMEAAAMARPVVATRITGCVDAVVDGVTGTLVPPGDPEALAEAVARYAADPQLRERHGLAGRERVLRDFRREDVWQGLLDTYRDLLQRAGQPQPAPPEPTQPQPETGSRPQ